MAHSCLSLSFSWLTKCGAFVDNKGNPRWLWHALDRRSEKVLVYVFGRRKDEVFLELKKLLEPCKNYEVGFIVVVFDNMILRNFMQALSSSKSVYYEHLHTENDRAGGARHCHWSDYQSL